VSLNRDIGDVIEAIVGLVLLFATLPTLISAINSVSSTIGAFGNIFAIFVFASLGLLIYGIFTLKNRFSLASIIALIVVLNLLAVGSGEVLKYVNGYDADGDGKYTSPGDIPPLNLGTGAGASILKMFINLFVGSGIGFFLLTLAILRRYGLNFSSVKI